jgi:hypothetical protein
LVCILVETVWVKRLQSRQYLVFTGISALGLSLFVLFNPRGITWAAWDLLDKIFGRSIIAPAIGWAIVAFGFSAIILLAWLCFQKRS